LEITLPAEQETADTPRAITFRAVSKTYGAHTAVHPLDLEIYDGEFFCLLGPSGCGKTTTLNLIGGFAAPSSGEIRIAGELVNTTPPHRRKVNTVFQSYALFPHLSVRENVGFGLKMERVERAEIASRVAEALHLVALEQYADRYPGQLSGGQQQRVAVARALVNRPAVLLLDEPLGSLDLKLRKHLQVELSQIQRDVGTTFVFVTHDQGEAMAMADRIAVMNAGRIEQLGTPREIYHRPASRFVADFIGESNFIPVERRGDTVVSARQGRQMPCSEILRAGSGSLMIRPESVQLTPLAEEESDSRLVGRVMKSAFLGTFTRVSIDCEVTDDPFLVELHSAKGEEIVDDMLVQLSWDADDAVLFHDVENKE